MRFIALALCALLLMNTYAAEVEDEAAVYAQIEQIESTEFGSQLIDTIELELASEGPVEDLIKMLQQIEAKLQQEQDDDNHFIDQEQQECDNTLDKLESEIKAAKDRVAELQGELNQKIPIRDDKTKQLHNKNEFRSLLEEKIVDLDNRKNLRDQEWAQTQEEHDKVAYSIQRAKEILVGALSAKNFLQKDAKMVLAQVSEHFAQHAQRNKFAQKSWNSIFKLLAAITANAPAQADQGMVGKVIQLCDDLLNKNAESREIERRDYQHWVSEYNQTRANVVDKLNEVKGQISNLENEVAALNKRINNATTERDEQLERINQKQTQYNEQLRYCDDENANYAKRREKRDADRQVVSQTIGLFQANLRLFRKYVADRQKNIKKKKF